MVEIAGGHGSRNDGWRNWRFSYGSSGVRRIGRRLRLCGALFVRVDGGDAFLAVGSGIAGGGTRRCGDVGQVGAGAWQVPGQLIGAGIFAGAMAQGGGKVVDPVDGFTFFRLGF